MSYLKAIDFDDIGVALPLLRRGLGGLDRRRRRGRFVVGEVDDRGVHVEDVQLVEAELQRRESWAELRLHAEHCDAEGTICEIELGVALQILEGELVFTAVLVNHNRVVRVVDVLEGMFGRMFLEVSLVWITGNDVTLRSPFFHHWFLVVILDVVSEGLREPKK